MDSYLEQMKGLREVTSRILQLNIRVARLRESEKITETHNKVLSFLSSRERASYDELKKYLKVSQQRVHQVLQPLRNAHILVEETIGNRIWFKLGSPEEETNEAALGRTVKKKLKSKTGDNRKASKQAKLYQQVLPIFDESSSS